MKKLLSLALALALCLGLTVPAFAVGQAGDTTIKDAKGNIYTLSQPILYTISAVELDCIQNEFALLDRFKEDVTTIYVISENTMISFPDGICMDGLIWVEIAEEGGTFRVVDEDAGGPIETSFGIDDSWGMTFIMLPCYLLSGKKELNSDSADNGESGIDGSSTGMFEDGSFVDYLAFYVPADGKAGDPFASLTATTPSKPAAPTTTGKPAFTDVAVDSPYADAIAWAVAQGITNGKTATVFGTKDICTISHILTFLWRANGRPGAKGGEAERDSVLRWANEQGMVVTADMLPSPCTRARAVNFMWMAAGKPKEKESTSFTDVRPDDFTKGIAWAVEKGITQGTSATTFSPDNICTRGQIVTFLYRAFK